MTLALVATTAVVFALTGDDEQSGDQPPIRSDEGIDPNECNLVHNITACDDPYGVTVQFNTLVTQGDIDEAGALIRAFDDDLDFIIMERFPPVGSALLALDAPDVCSTIEAQLEAKSYVSDVSCRPWQPVDVDDPDGTVEQRNEANEPSAGPGQLDESSCDPVPLRSDCGIDPDECNLIHNINACTEEELEPRITPKPRF